MGRIKKEIQNEAALLEKFGGDIRYNPLDSYTAAESFYGDGKYPPDWANRREVIWWLQEQQCGRCRKDLEPDTGHVHHMRPLSEGGDNALDNLVGLCEDCHALLHPEVSDLAGDWRRAPVFPVPDAVPGVAVIRRAGDSLGSYRNLDADLTKLGEQARPIKNVYAAQSGAVYSLDSTLSRNLAAESTDETAFIETLNEELLARDIVPENTGYDARRLSVSTPLSGVLGWFSSYEPTVTLKPAGEAAKPHRSPVIERVQSDSAESEFLCSADVDTVQVSVIDGHGDAVERTVPFGDSRSQSLSLPVTPPPLSTSTAGSYLRNFGNKTFLFPLIYLLLWLLFVPLAGIVLFFSVIGMLMGAAGTAGWFVIALLFGGSWWQVAEIALATVLALVLGSISIVVLEQFGIDVGE